MNFPKKLKRLAAILLAVGTMAGSVQLPVAADDSTDSSLGDTIPENAIGVDFKGEGSVIVEQNGKETAITEYTLFTGNVGDEITIKASENDSGQKMTAMAVFMEDGTSFNANENHDSSAEYTAKIGTDRYINVLFERRQLVRRMAASYTPSDAEIPSSGSGTLWATAPSMFDNQFTLQWISAPLDRFADTIKQYLGECTHHGWLAWTDDNPYNVKSLNYTYSFVGDDTTKYLTITVADDTTHTGYSAAAGGTAGYQGIQWTNIPITIVIPTKTIHVDVNKVNGNPTITENNDCYSLGGATYGIWLDEGLTQKISEVTTDANGKASIDIPNVDNGVNTVWVKEITPSKRFYIDETKYRVDLNNNSGAVTSTEMPGNDPLTITLNKVSDDGNYVANPDPLENAKFTVKYYAGQYSSVDQLANVTPTRTWVLRTLLNSSNGKYTARLTDKGGYKVSGDDFYYEYGLATLPLGTVTVEETEAPKGYTLKNAIINEVSGSTVTQTNGVALFQIVENGPGKFQVQGGNEYTASETPVRASSVKVQKYVTDSGTTLQGDMTDLTTHIKVTNNNDYDVVLKDGNTVLATASAGQDFKKPDGSTYEIVTGTDGSWTSPTNWISYGTYTLTETQAPAGTLISGKTVQQITIDQDGQTIDLTDINGKSFADTIVRAGFKVQKTDAETDTRPQGDADLTASFNVFNASANPVKVNGYMYQPGEVVYSFTTDKTGYYETAVKNLLPYGTYRIHETKAPKGYKTAADYTFKVTEADNNSIIDLTGSVGARNLPESPILGGLNLIKYWDYTSGTSSFSTPEKGAEFTVILKSYVLEKYDADGDGEVSIDEARTAAAALKADVRHDGLTVREYRVLVTGDDGRATTGRTLAYGKYILFQTASPSADVEMADNVMEYDCTNLVADDSGKKISEDDLPTYNYQAHYAEGRYSADNDTKSYPLTIVKKDKATGEVVGYTSTDFKVFWLKDVTGKDVNEYVTQKVGRKKYDTFRSNAEKTSSKGSGVYGVDTDDKGTVTVPLELEAGTYRIDEVSAPEMYRNDNLNGTIVSVRANDLHETDAEGNPIAVVTMEDTQYTGTLSVKKDVVKVTSDYSLIDRKDLSGIGFELRAAEDIRSASTGAVLTKKGDIANNIYGNPVGQFHVDKDGNAKIADLPIGKYTLTEVVVPDGFVRDTKEYSVVFTKEAAAKDPDGVDYKIENITNQTTVKAISKLSVTGSKELPGAKMSLLDGSGKVVTSWTSTEKDYVIEGLTVGASYTLVEDLAPVGYVKAHSITFTVEDKAEQTKTVMYDKIVDITKEDVGGKEVKGAKMTVTDSTGKTVDSWTSDGTAHKVTGLEEGKTYTIHEVTAPDGYVTATDITFTVSGADKDGKKENQSFTVIDKRVLVTKQDTQGETVDGAELSVFDKDGNLVDQWTTVKGEGHYVNGLHAGQSYTLKETKVPDGYVKAADITINVADDGKDQSEFFINKQVTVSKVDAGGEEVIGADMTVVDENGNVVDQWTSDGTDHKVNGLEEGKSYTIHEVTAPNGYVAATDIPFTVSGADENGKKEDQEYTVTDKRVQMLKVDMCGTDVDGAQLSVFAKDGSMVDQWTTKAGDHHFVNGLRAGQTYTVKETVVPEGFVKAADYTFTVADDGKDQTETIVDKQVEISKEDAGGKEVEGAKLTITDKETGQAVDSWTSGKQTHYASGLEVGRTYTLTEDTAPLGYVKATSIDFTVNDDGVDQKVTMVDTIERLAKVDDKGNVLKGATLEARDEDGNVIDTWESGKHIVDLTEDQVADLEKGNNVEFELEDGSKVTVYALVKTTTETEDDSKDSDLTAEEIKEQACKAKELRKAGKTEETPAPDKDAEYTYQAVIVRPDGTYEYRDIDLNGDETTHMVQNLEADRKYTVVETTAPDGYYWTADGDVNATGTEDHVTTMTDNSINYQIAKVDDNGDYVKGVTLQLTDVTDKDNPVAVELPNNGVTTDEPFLLENKLIADHKYELVESEYVAGLYQATSMTFTVPHSGTSEVTTITMKDVLTNVAVTKVDNHGKPVSGAKMSVLKAEKDDDGNIVPVTDERGNVESVYDFTSTDEYTDISDYVKGSNDVSGDVWYILREDEAPFGFEKTEDIPFIVSGTNDQHQVIMATDVRKTYAVSAVKVDANDEDKHLKGAEITLFDAEGNIVKDINGKECVGVTDGTGVITWQIEYNGDGTVDTGYYVKETAAPKGYRINKNNFAVMLSEDYDFAKDNPVIITVSDTLLPARGVQTGYGSSIFPYEIAGMIAGLAAITCLVLRDEKKRLRNKKD